MKLNLIRKFKGEKYTIGDLLIDGEFFCHTIEDTVRDLPETCPGTPKGILCKCEGKIHAETAVPAGTYRVTMEYSNRFKRVLPYLHNVPHFIGILIHSGNTEKDSAGCIIVGENTQVGKVLNSRATLEKLINRLDGETEIKIEIINGCK